MSWQLLHRETDAPGSGDERVDGDRFEDQPLAAEAVFERELVARERLAADDGAQLERKLLERRTYSESGRALYVASYNAEPEPLRKTAPGGNDLPVVVEKM
jgi:hypothetical protein